MMTPQQRQLLCNEYEALAGRLVSYNAERASQLTARVLELEAENAALKAELAQLNQERTTKPNE